MANQMREVGLHAKLILFSCDNFSLKYSVCKWFSPLDYWYFFALNEIHFEYFFEKIEI